MVDRIRRQPLGADDREQPALVLAEAVAVDDVFDELRLVGLEPAEVAGEVGQAVQRGLAQRRRGAQRQQADHRPHPQRNPLAGVEGQDVVVEAVLLVPQAPVVDGGGDVGEVLEELGGQVLVGVVVLGEHQGDLQQVQAVHGHPDGAVGLLEAAVDGQGGRAVDGADVVQAQEAALEDVVAGGVLAVDPPGEVQEQLVEDALEEVRSRVAPSISKTRRAAQAWTGGLTSPKSHS